MSTQERFGVAAYQQPVSRNYKTWFIIAVGTAALSVGLAGCGGKKSAFSGKGSPIYSGPNPIPKGGGVRKVGSPYEIAGKRYYPKPQPGYRKRGMASWYGPKFHRRKTANGEWYDMESITAAHKTLPMPSFVRVTNLKNGKSLVARLNDRGPYAHDRIIDMSKRSAEMLGFKAAGTAPVEVVYLGPAPLNGDDYYVTQAKLKSNRVVTATKSDRARPQPDIEPASWQDSPTHTGSIRKSRSAARSMASSGHAYVQAGSFSDPGNAARVEQQLSRFGHANTVETHTGSSIFYRVTVGPLQNGNQAAEVLSQVRSAGHHDARIVTR